MRAIVIPDEQELMDTLIALKEVGVSCWTQKADMADPRILRDNDRKLDN